MDTDRIGDNHAWYRPSLIQQSKDSFEKYFEEISDFYPQVIHDTFMTHEILCSEQRW